MTTTTGQTPRHESDTIATAYRIRAEAALPLDERDAALASLARAAVAVVTEVAESDRVALLRARGGWTAIIAGLIGEQPEADTNEIGMPTNRNWWRHRVLTDAIPQIRVLAQRAAAEGSGNA